MSINGTYKINIEMSARKQVNGLLATAKRLMGHVGVQDVHDPPDKDEHVQQIIAMFKENQDVIDSVSVTIEETAVTIRSSDGEMVCTIKGREQEDSDHLLLVMEDDELDEMTWAITVCGGVLLIDSDDEFSEYVLERQ